MSNLIKGLSVSKGLKKIDINARETEIEKLNEQNVKFDRLTALETLYLNFAQVKTSDFDNFFDCIEDC
jgi:hypothetical protein